VSGSSGVVQVSGYLDVVESIDGKIILQFESASGDMFIINEEAVEELLEFSGDFVTLIGCVKEVDDDLILAVEDFKMLP
jgi:hypothetical protein